MAYLNIDILMLQIGDHDKNEALERERDVVVLEPIVYRIPQQSIGRL